MLTTRFVTGIIDVTLYFICLLLLLCHFFTFLCHFDRSTYYSLLKESIADSVLVRLEFSIKNTTTTTKKQTLHK